MAVSAMQSFEEAFFFLFFCVLQRRSLFITLVGFGILCDVPYAFCQRMVAVTTSSEPMRVAPIWQ